MWIGSFETCWDTYPAVNCIATNLLALATQHIYYWGSSTVLGTVDKSMNDAKSLLSKYFSE